jgi:uncharacterized membrane protein YphA (DoxX/SURF4 family)
MKALVWIVQILVSIAFLGAGFMKLTSPYNLLVAEPNMAWVADFSEMQVKLIGFIELLGAIGLIIPMFTKKYQKLVPLAAIGLALVMLGAMITHLIRGESIVVNLILMTFAVLTAYWRKDIIKKRS